MRGRRWRRRRSEFPLARQDVVLIDGFFVPFFIIHSTQTGALCLCLPFRFWFMLPLSLLLLHLLILPPPLPFQLPLQSDASASSFHTSASQTPSCLQKLICSHMTRKLVKHQAVKKKLVCSRMSMQLVKHLSNRLAHLFTSCFSRHCAELRETWCFDGGFGDGSPRRLDDVVNLSLAFLNTFV